ncbi:MAG: hypothetical protein ACOC9B_04020 [Chloroflexota bacterium]
MVCELRYIDSYRLRFELGRSMPAVLPVEPSAGLVVHGPDGMPIGSPAMLLSILWGELKLPCQPGMHAGVPLLADGYFVTYAGFRVAVRILADYRVERRFYAAELQPGLEGLRRVAETGTPLSPRMLGRWLSPHVIRRTWRRVEDAQWRRRTTIHLTVLDAIT